MNMSRRCLDLIKKPFGFTESGYGIHKIRMLDKFNNDVIMGFYYIHPTKKIEFATFFKHGKFLDRYLAEEGRNVFHMYVAGTKVDYSMESRALTYKKMDMSGKIQTGIVSYRQGKPIIITMFRKYKNMQFLFEDPMSFKMYHFVDRARYFKKRRRPYAG